MKMNRLTADQELAVKAMARRQLHRWPETQFEITSQHTWTDHPSCGGTNKLRINSTTAMSLVGRGLCVMNSTEDRVWLSPGAMQLISIGNEIGRDR